MKRAYFFIFILNFVLFAENALAHGEDVPGPHGGYIRMPGGFHTELVLQGKEIRAYLLDISFMNPQTKDSEVSARYLDKDLKSYRLDCAEKKEFFACKLPKEFTAKAGKIAVQGKRGEMFGQLAEYPLPLPGFKKIEKPSKSKMEHGHH